MLEILRSISILLLIFFLIWTIYVIIKSLVTFNKTKRLFKSSFNSTWKTFLSSFLVILFFGVSFSVIIGTSSSISRIEKSMNELLVENNLHMSYVDLDRIESTNNKLNEFNSDLELDKSGEYWNTREIDNVQEYLYYYFDQNPTILEYYAYLYLMKGMSHFTYNDYYTNLNWKYELSYYYTQTNVNWGYQYISINDYDILKMLIDIYNDNVRRLEYYRQDSYDEPNVTQSSMSQNNGESYFLIDDYQINESEHGLGVDELFLNQYSQDYDVVVGVGTDWAKMNDVSVGDIIELPQPYGNDINAKVAFTFRAPQYVYPSFDVSKVIPDAKDQTYVLMASSDFLKYFGENATATSWFGFNNLYNDVSSYDDFNSRYLQNKTEEYINSINLSTYVFFDNAYMYAFNDPSNYISIGIMTAYMQIGLMKVVSVVLLFIFLIITIGIIAVLIKKKIQSNKPQLGTLKALGWKYEHISLSFISFPLTLILIGSILAIFLSVFIQGIWITSWGSHFLISSGNFTLGLREFIILIGIPVSIFISLSYLIAKRILKKPTVDLLTNIDYNKPNILVKTFSPLTTRIKNFKVSYQIKNTLRGVGKSFVIFGSVLFSFLIISFAISGVNLINNSIIRVVDTIKADNLYLLGNTEDINYINGESIDVNAQFDEYYMFNYSIDYQMVQDCENADDVWEVVEQTGSIEFNGNSQLDRAEQMDEFFGQYILNENFNQNKNVIPWQAFEILNYGLNQVEEGESYKDYENIPLNTTGLTFNDYLNIYNQYVNYLNLNKQNKEDDEDIINPDILINTIVYDENFFPYINENISWDEYQDDYNDSIINSVYDLGFHRNSNYKVTKTTTKIGDEEWIVDDNYNPIQTVNDYLENSIEYDNEISSDYISSYYEEESRSEKYEVDNVEYNDVTYVKVERNSYSKNDKFNTQWISSFENSSNIGSSVVFDEEDANKLNDYTSKSVTINYEHNGVTSNQQVETIPIIIDSINAERLNIEQGDIIKTNYYDEEELLNNNLELSDSINEGAAFEIVGVFDYGVPVGAFTLNQYLEDQIEDIEPLAFIQGDKEQQEYYTMTSSVFSDNSTLDDDFNNGFRSVYDSIISKDVYTEQLFVLTNSIKMIFFLFAFFAGLIAMTLIFISINEIAENSIKEISILKANGISNKQSTLLILTPYLIIIMLAILIAIPINVLFFLYLSSVINGFLGGITINLGMSIFQWFILIFIIAILFLIIFWMVYRNLLKKATLKGLT